MIFVNLCTCAVRTLYMYVHVRMHIYMHADRIVRELLDFFRTTRGDNFRMVWTVHDVRMHDSVCEIYTSGRVTAFPSELEEYLVREIVKVADAIHVMCKRTVSLMEKRYGIEIPLEKVPSMLNIFIDFFLTYLYILPTHFVWMPFSFIIYSKFLHLTLLSTEKVITY